MSSSYGESMGAPSQNPSYSGSTIEAGNFECNICFDLAQDPIVTLCGHLFCWPCLYKWLHFHSQSHECPVCKAFIQEDRLVPLYGRGKTSSDPRSRSVPGVDIPNRPTGQRPETAPPPPPPPENNNHFPQHGLGFMGGSGWGGFPPMPATRPGNYALSASWGGLLPQLFNFQMHGFPSATMYGGGTGYPYGYAHHYHGAHPHAYPHRPNQRQQDNYLKLLFIVIGTLVLLTLISA